MTITADDRTRARHLKRHLDDAKAEMADWDRLIPMMIATLAAITEQRRSTGTQTGPRGSDVSDPTGNAVIAGAEALELDWQIRFQATTVFESINSFGNLMRAATRLLPPQSIPTALKCSAGPDMAGYSEWGRTDDSGPVACGAIADKAGMCGACFMRQYRWKQTTKVDA